MEKKTYLYRTTDNFELIEVEMTFEELQKNENCGFITLPGGREARRAVKEELERDGVVPKPEKKIVTRPKWSMISVRAGVHPEQIDELRQQWDEHGVTGCRVLPNGDVEYADRAARRRDFKSRDMHDRDGGYGDG